MKTIKASGMAFVVILALSMTTASVASAHEFIAEKNAVGKALRGATVTNAVFQIEAEEPANYIECTASKVTEGALSTERWTSLAVTIQYENCTGHLGIFSAAAKISAAHYTFSAEGTVQITKPITIETALGNQTVEEQTVGTVKYENMPADEATNMAPSILIIAAVTGIKSTGAFGNASNGTYTGTLLLWVGPFESHEEGISWA